MYLTKAHLEAAKSATNGWNKKQTTCLGEQWPLQSGWLLRMTARDHSEETIAKFISLRTRDKPVPQEKVSRRKKPRLTRKEKRERRALKLNQNTHYPIDVPWGNYSEYLDSDLWFSIRRAVLLLAGHECCVCHKPATQVHHKRYDRLTMRGRDISKLVAICAACHHRIEFDDQGQKVDLATANQRLETFQGQHDSVDPVTREFLEMTKR